MQATRTCKQHGLFAFYTVLLTRHPFRGVAVVSKKLYKLRRRRQQCPHLKPTMPSVLKEDRLRMIHLFQEGMRQRDIAKATGRPLCTVNRNLQAFRDEGRIENLPRGRRPRATTGEQDMLIVAVVALKPSLTSQQIKCELDLSASTKTVRRRLQDVQQRNCVPARKPKLSEANKLARLRFAEDHATWTAEDWSCVLFMDESTFSSRWDQRQRIWRAVNTSYE